MDASDTSSLQSPGETVGDQKHDAPDAGRLDTLLQSNEPPKAAEIPFLRTITSEMGARLVSIDDEIEQLQTRRRTLALSHEQHKSVLSPLRSLAPEILGEIFAWTLPTVSEAFCRSQFQFGESPWNLTHVCSNWRAIAISAPSLWSLLVLPYSQYDYPMEAVETQVHRAQRLKIHFDGSNVERSEAPQVQMLQYLIQHSPRWEEFWIVLTQALHALLPALSNRVPALRRLWIEWCDEDDEDSPLSIHCFQKAESLVDVNIIRDNSSVSFLAPLNQLTRYCFDAPWETHQELLRGNPSLVEAHISVLFPETVLDWTVADIIELPQLQCLYVSRVEILAHLRVPNLEQITIELVSSETRIIPAFDRFLTNSSSTVRKLGVRGAPDMGLIRDILTRLPSLAELAVILRSVDDEESDPDADPLISLLSDTGILPRLSRIHLAFEGRMVLDYNHFLEMLNLRVDIPDHALQSAAILFENGHHPSYNSLSTVLESLEQAGLDFSATECTNVVDEMVQWLYLPTWIRNRD